MVSLKPIKERRNLESIKDFIKVEDTKPVLQTEEIKQLSQEIKKSKNTILQMGAHVIKTGQSLILIDLMKKGFIHHLALNGAGAIHDFEISLIGETSEDVEENLPDGSFGMWHETSKINDIINQAAQQNIGFGQALGKYISENHPHKEYSLFAAAHELNIPITVHVALGTDIIHMHPNFSGEATGKTSHIDFQKYTESVKKLENGVLINLGCAVIMPEVFLKALAIARNKGHNVENFTAANIDQIIHYRPTQNIVKRPKGKAFNIQAKHQESIQSLHYYVVKEE